MTGLINVALRAATMASKFILVIFLARLLSPSALGEFSLVSTTIGIAIFIVGLDFYNYSGREMVSQEREEWAFCIRNQFAFYIAAYLLVSPFLIFVFLAGTLNWRYVIWFYGILLVEHLSQEFYRILTVIGESVKANFVLFIRSGSWVYLSLALMLMQADFKSLETIFAGWLFGGTLSLLLAIIFLRDLNWKSVVFGPIDIAWIKRGIHMSLPFFGATLALKGVESIDRYFLQVFKGEAVVGVLSFYANIANAVYAFTFSGVVMILYPKIIHASKTGAKAEYQFLVRKLAMKTMASTMILSCLAGVLVFPMLALVGNEIYTAYIGVFWLLLATSAFSSMSLVPHYALYSQRQDRKLFYSTVAAFLIALLANGTLVPVFGIYGAALSSMLAMAVLAGLKYVVLVRSRIYDRI